jgi:hypothetical protein
MHQVLYLPAVSLRYFSQIFQKTINHLTNQKIRKFRVSELKLAYL